MLSVCILTYNEENHIGRALECISKLKCEHEILVIDSHSVDKTKEIAVRYPNVRFIENTFSDFSTQRNFGIQNAKGSWIFMLDADEYPSEGLIRWLNESRYQEQDQIFAWNVPRKNYFLGSELKHTFPDYQKRIFKKEQSKYERSVHEQLKHEGTSRNLAGTTFIEHEPDIKLSKWFEKVNAYTDKEVGEFDKNGFQYRYPKLSLFIYPLAIFIIGFFIKGGIRDGIRGVIFVMMNSIYKFMQISKLIERNRW